MVTGRRRRRRPDPGGKGARGCTPVQKSDSRFAGACGGMRLLLSEHRQALRTKSQPPPAERLAQSTGSVPPGPTHWPAWAGRPRRAAPWQVPWAETAALSPSPFPFTGRGIEPQGGGGSAPPTPTSPGPQQGFGDHPGTHGSQSTPAANRTPSAPHPSPAVPVTCRLTQDKDVGAASLTMTPGRRRPQRPRGAAPHSAGSRGQGQVCGALQGALHALLFWKATCSALCSYHLWGKKKTPSSEL